MSHATIGSCRPLAPDLLSKHRLALTGTLRKDKREIPKLSLYPHYCPECLKQEKQE